MVVPVVVLLSYPLIGTLEKAIHIGHLNLVAMMTVNFSEIYADSYTSHPDDKHARFRRKLA